MISLENTKLLLKLHEIMDHRPQKDKTELKRSRATSMQENITQDYQYSIPTEISTNA